MANGIATRSSRGHRTICVPISEERYPHIVNDPQEFRRTLDECFRYMPELFPTNFARGYQRKDTRRSPKQDIPIRRIVLNDGVAFSVIEKVVNMPLVPINRVIDEHFNGKGPDYLSIDVESLDLAILKTLDFSRFRPKVICAETLVALGIRNDLAISALLAGHGYEARGMTFANTIYIDKTLVSIRRVRCADHLSWGHGIEDGSHSGP